MAYQDQEKVVSNGSIFNDLNSTTPNPVFKATPLFDAGYLTNG